MNYLSYPSPHEPPAHHHHLLHPGGQAAGDQSGEHAGAGGQSGESVYNPILASSTDYRLAAGCGVLGLVIVWLGAPATYSQYTVLSTL